MSVKRRKGLFGDCELIYEYRCDKGHKFEVFHVKEKQQKCPICKAKAKKLMSMFSTKASRVQV